LLALGVESARRGCDEPPEFTPTSSEIQSHSRTRPGGPALAAGTARTAFSIAAAAERPSPFQGRWRELPCGRPQQLDRLAPRRIADECRPASTWSCRTPGSPASRVPRPSAWCNSSANSLWKKRAALALRYWRRSGWRRELRPPDTTPAGHFPLVVPWDPDLP
jgi:hypothetical protein